jgi:hypothetical protein
MIEPAAVIPSPKQPNFQAFQEPSTQLSTFPSTKQALARSEAKIWQHLLARANSFAI